MLICGDCSTPNKDGENFCSNCGAYLVWQREPQNPGQTASPVVGKPDPGPGPAEETRLMSTLPPHPEHVPGRRSDAPRVTRTVLSPGDEDTLGVITAQKRADFTAFGGEQPAPETAGPAEVHPGFRAVHAPETVQPRHDEAAPAPGDLVCGRCGAGNHPDRNFCRRCAASLKEAEVEPPLTWWRRLLRRRTKPALPAGARPKRKRWHFPAKLVSFLAVMGLFGGVTYASRDIVATAVARVQDNLFSTDIRAQKITASSSAPGRGPELAVDTFSNRSWAAGVPGNTSNQYLDVVFDGQIRLAYVFISAGASSDQATFVKERRPRDVEITVARTDAEPMIKTFALKDVTARQQLYIGADRVSALRLRIVDSTGPDDQAVAVAEVQFLGR